VDRTVGLVLITGVLSALGGVGIWTFLSKWLEIGANRESGEITRLRDDLQAADARHEACEQKIAVERAAREELERRLEAVEHHHSSYMARWIKDAGKRVVWLNSPALLTIFAPLGYSRNDIIGRTFVELLDPEAAREIDRLDRDALAIPGKAVSTLVRLHQSLPPMVVVKVAGAGRDSELIYEGYAYCENNPRQALERAGRREEEQRGLSQLRLAGPDAGEAGTEPPIAI
jgi:hypothetical protein